MMFFLATIQEIVTLLIVSTNHFIFLGKTG